MALTALLAGNGALALSPMFVRMASDQALVGPIAAGVWRLALAAPILLVLTPLTKQATGRLDRRLVGMIALAGVFFAADLAAWHLGILKTKLANATLFGNVASLIFPIYGFLVARAWPSATQGSALSLAALGAVLLMGRSYEADPRYFVGDLLCLAAGLLYTIYLVLIDRVRAVLTPWPVLTLSTLAGILPLLAFAVATGERIWPASWGPVFGLALVSQVLGQGLMIFAIGHVRPLLVGVALLSQPVIAAAIGWSLYGERLGLIDLVGALLIAIAIFLVRRPAPSRNPVGE